MEPGGGRREKLPPAPPLPPPPLPPSKGKEGSGGSNSASRLEKARQRAAQQELKQRQRAEIYALNRVMTELEQQQFDAFCKQMQASGEGPVLSLLLGLSPLLWSNALSIIFPSALRSYKA